MNRWHIIIEAWPYSSGRGHDADQAAAGERVQSYYVDAYDMKEALKLATCIADGMRSNPDVWLTPITTIAQAKP